MGKKTDEAVEMLDLPMMSREAPVTTVNVENRTVDLVWSTGASVKRYDWKNCRYYLEELSLDPKHVRMGRLQSGSAPLLDTHWRMSLACIIGVVQSASLKGGEGLATSKFSKREDVEPYFQDVVDGIIRNVSVGYVIHAIEMIPPTKDGELWIYRAIDWEPTELSLVPIGADADAGTRCDNQATNDGKQSIAMQPCRFITRTISQLPAAAGSTRKETTMGDKVQENGGTPAATTAQNDAQRQRELDQARAEGARLEVERQAGIREAVQLGGLDAAYADQLIREVTMTAADAGMAVLREKAKRDAAVPIRGAAHVSVVDEKSEHRRDAMCDAIILRANPGADFSKDVKRMDGAREYRGMNLIDMARACIEAQGGNTRGLSRREIAVMALNLDRGMQVRAGMQSTSDFSNILASTVGRTLRSAYALQPRTFTGWARRATAPDFRQIARTQLSESSAMQAVKEGAEYKAITFGDSAEKYALGKFGGIVALTWETLVNDDLSAFDRIPMALAAEAAAIEGDVVYGIFAANAAMSDTKALFHADHSNLASPGTVISDTTLTAGRAAMRAQKGLKNRVLNLTPSFLIVGPAKEGEANKYTSAQFVAAKAGDINPNFNTSLEVVVDGRISGNTWYLAAAPTLVDTVEYAYLEGEEGLFIETRQGFEVDGLQIKARHVFAAKAIDHRGLYKNPGA